MAPVFLRGLLSTYFLEKIKTFSYGAQIPNVVRSILIDYDQHMDQKRTTRDKARLAVQALIGVWLIVGLAARFASVGLISLFVIILATSMSGLIQEHALGKAFEKAFFSMVRDDVFVGSV
jgi:NhaB family Na+:H+ antiporter